MSGPGSEIDNPAADATAAGRRADTPPRASNDIWVWADRRSERLFDLSLNFLARAGEMAAERSGRTVLCFFAGSDAEPAAALACPDADDAARRAMAHGADDVMIFQPEAPILPRADRFAAALAETVARLNPSLVLFPLTDFGRDLAARTASLAEAGLIADCTALALEDGRLVADCPAWGGEIMARIIFADEGVTGFATVRPHAFKRRHVPGRTGTVRRVAIDGTLGGHGLRRLKAWTEPGSSQNLEEAETVVVGGAGLGSPEGFGLVRDLAAALGGQVGATRPPVLQHWVDGARLIGQTGKTVRPRLLITAGTSGAVQYVAGITASKTIVAVNRDAKAPIFDIADIGVVQDAGDFLPRVTERVRKQVMRQMADMVCGQPRNSTGSGIGCKIRQLREAHGWTGQHLAQITGQTPEYIDQVESEAFSPSVGFLLRLAGVLKVDPGTFLGKDRQARIDGRREREFVKRTRNYSYRTLTPGAESDHLRAFMVTIESRQAHKPVAYRHEGEEFVFVMEGDLELTLDRKPHHLKAGESMHFNSETPHRLKSLSATPTRCLVVLYTI